MGTTTLELHAVCVKDWEDDHLYEIAPEKPGKGFIGGISALIQQAGGTCVGDVIVPSFEYEGEDPHWEKFREMFREGTGLEVPAVMRVRVTVEVENLSPEESKALWMSHNAKAQQNRRAKGHAWAVSEEQTLYDTLKANLAAGTQATPDELKQLAELRAQIAELQPHTLRWEVATADGNTFPVETRDMIDWCDDHSKNTMVVGALAEVPCRAPEAMTVSARESAYRNDGLAKRDRESDHRMAVEILGTNNDWHVTDIKRNGERWDP